MTENPIDSFILESPLELNGSIPEDKAIFYNLAKQKIHYQNSQENSEWNQRLGRNKETSATYVISAEDGIAQNGDITRWVKSLEIVINQGLVDKLGTIAGENFNDIIPYLVEHEIYEAWLSAKRGSANSLDINKKHLLARRRQFYLAEKDGLGNKLFQFQMAKDPRKKEEYEMALSNAKKRLKTSSEEDKNIVKKRDIRPLAQLLSRLKIFF